MNSTNQRKENKMSKMSWLAEFYPINANAEDRIRILEKIAKNATKKGGF